MLPPPVDAGAVFVFWFEFLVFLHGDDAAFGMGADEEPCEIHMADPNLI